MVRAEQVLTSRLWHIMPWQIAFFLVFYSAAFSNAQDIALKVLQGNNTSKAELNTENKEKLHLPSQSDLWLFTRDDPVPVYLNRHWPAENHTTGIRIIEALETADKHEFQVTNFPTPRSSNGSSQNPGELAYDKILAEAAHRSQPGNLYFRPNAEAILVELPREVTAGVWEKPRPRLMEQLSASRRKIIAVKPTPINLDKLQFSSQTVESVAAILPTQNVSSRLPIPESDVIGRSEITGLSTEVPHQDFRYSKQVAENVKNISSDNISVLQPNETDVSFSNVGPVTYNIPEIFQVNGDGIIYEISLDDLPPTSTHVEEVGEILTREDIEILEKLGIFSSLNLESALPNNITDFGQVEISQKDAESDPAIIHNNGQNYRLIHEGGNGVTINEVVLIDVPQFTPSEYHGNIPAVVGNKERLRPLPYVLSEADALQSISSNKTDVKRQENSSAYFTDLEIIEILQLLNLSSAQNSNITAITQIAVGNKTETHDSSGKSASNLNKRKSSIESASVSVDKSSNKALSEKQLQSKFSTAASVKDPDLSNVNSHMSTPSKLVSSGIIQPRLLDRLDTNYEAIENEVLELISKKLYPISENKIEVLRKLKIHPKPYHFGFKQLDGNGTLQHRNENSNSAGVINGSYGYRDAMGIYRNVSYVADKSGFHAVVKTNEPGTITHNSADVVVLSEIPPRPVIIQMLKYAKEVKNNSSSKSV